MWEMTQHLLFPSMSTLITEQLIPTLPVSLMDTLRCFCREKEAHNQLGGFLPAPNPRDVFATEQQGS